MIDPIYSDSMMGREDEWIPINPGTDAALVEGIAYVLITENLIDKPFLDKYCIGLRRNYFAEISSQELGLQEPYLRKRSRPHCQDTRMASKETGIPKETIIRLAREIGTTKPLFVAQGWGPQRRGNGDSFLLRSQCFRFLPVSLVFPAQTNGAREADQNGFAASLPVPPNPVKASVCLNVWHRAIYEADQ